ncbi:MAG: hypothetical protein FJ276_20715 [Planctomycetes bacterium]|nr:hypothetical protein [Planctomycetota bacterium]
MSKPPELPPQGYPGPPPQSGAKTTVIVLAIVVGVLMVLFLMCGGLVLVAFRWTRSAVDTNMRQLVEQAEKQAQEARERQEKVYEENQAEWAGQGEGQRFAERFLAALRENRFADAYRETTATFREKYHSDKDLEQFTRAHSALQKPAMLFDADFNQQDATRQRFQFNAMEGEMMDMKIVKVSVSVVKDGLNWRVDELTVSDDPFPGMPKS